MISVTRGGTQKHLGDTACYVSIAEHGEERLYKNSQQFVDIFCEWPPKREVDAHFGFESMMGQKGSVIVGRGLLQIGFHLAVQV